MTPDQIKLNMPVMTTFGKGVVVWWGLQGSMRYLVKIEGYSSHNGGGVQFITKSNETLDEYSCWFNAEDLTAIEEPTHYIN